MSLLITSQNWTKLAKLSTWATIHHLIRPKVIKINFINNKFIHYSSQHCAAIASQSPLSLLRKRTGLAYNLCREALNKHNNNLDEAEAWLTAESLRHGWQKATRLQDRSAREGLIGIAIDSTNSMASVVEVNCETDFVAKNKVFQDLVANIIRLVSSTQKFVNNNRSPDQCSSSTIDEDINSKNEKAKVSKFLIPEKELQMFDEEIYPFITKLGERIHLSRAAVIHARQYSDNSHKKMIVQLYGDVHGGPQTSENQSNSSMTLMMGRFASLIGVEFSIEKLNNIGKENEKEKMEKIGRRLCKHIIGFSPSYIELPDNIRKHLEAAKVEQQQRQQQQIETNNNDDSEDYDSDAEEKRSLAERNSTDDWPSMMDQSLIMDDSGRTVRKFCQENQINIVDINRFECGRNDK